MDAVGRSGYLFPYNMLHFLSKLLRKLNLATRWEWMLSFYAGEETRICSVATMHGEGAWSFCVYVQFILHFVLLALNCARLGALQYWLGYICKCEASVHKSTC